MMSQLRVTDDEMRYYQFRARQMFQLRMEDHKWNEFCKNNKCTCCVCQTETHTKVNKETGSQTVPKVTRPVKGQNARFATKPQDKIAPMTSLNEIKEKLDKINVALANMQTSKVEYSITQDDSKSFHKDNNPSDSGTTIDERRVQWIQRNLKSSLGRLQSAAARMKTGPSFVTNKRRESGYILPHELVRQRAMARRAYLASLANHKPVERTPLPTKSKLENKKGKPLQNATETLVKSTLPLKKKNVNKRTEKEEAVTFQELKDENITKAVDDIIDDLLGETLVLVHQKKRLMCGTNISELGQAQKANGLQATNKRRSELSATSMPENVQNNKWETVRQKLSNVRQFPLRHNTRLPEAINTLQSQSTQLDSIIDGTRELQNTQHENERVITEFENSKLPMKNLTIDPEVAQEVTQYRKEFGRYLGKILRVKQGTFDPLALSNMVSESILNDCLQDISEEFQGVPPSLITDLYNQEFQQSA